MDAKKVKAANNENEGMLKMLMLDIEQGTLAFSKCALLGYRTIVAKNIEIIKQETAQEDEK